MTTPDPLGGGSQQPAYPQKPETTPTTPAGDTSPNDAKARRNVLAVIAFVVAIVGFIFACVPGALVVGWVLLPIAFILSIVSLFLPGRGKGLGIAGLVLSVVGTVVGVIVFFAVIASSVSDAFGSGSTVIETSTAAATADEAEAADEPAATPAGTRDNPVALGATISSDDWTVVVNSYSADANAAVAEANSFNESPAAGSHYELVNYTVTYTGEDSSYASFVTIDLVTGAGNVISSFDNFVVLTDGFGLDELFAGASATGSQAFLVPDGETVLLRVGPGIMADEVFVKP